MNNDDDAAALVSLFFLCSRRVTLNDTFSNTHFYPANGKQRRAVAFARYDPQKRHELETHLFQNFQMKTGKKEYLLAKCVDGEVYGRLALCPLCGRVLKLEKGGFQVVCNGHWNVQYATRVRCDYDQQPSLAPRWHPWYVLIRWVHFRQTLRSLILHLLYFISQVPERANGRTEDGSERPIRCRHGGPCCCTACCLRCEGEEEYKHCNDNKLESGLI
jgi:hypothetical protein